VQDRPRLEQNAVAHAHLQRTRRGAAAVHCHPLGQGRAREVALNVRADHSQALARHRLDRFEGVGRAQRRSERRRDRYQARLDAPAFAHAHRLLGILDQQPEARAREQLVGEAGELRAQALRQDPIAVQRAFAVPERAQGQTDHARHRHLLTTATAVLPAQGVSKCAAQIGVTDRDIE
jgi:hypothetical protein